ncbi:XRE family transcriptional regulator [Cupriavidus necator]|uniref:XRE family transcriptional regulator n=1 Tax=Cupriavidus necator TaxID=106590 RepID=A0A1U9UWQ0_CUPNE|nr:helix-turn-helix transcriptional regulator [Cupriavidus necator]AQV96555.1 XRE family transcriptional regulator [Cupriavidus necator]
MKTSIPEEEYAILLKALRVERELREITQVELASRLGVEQTFVSKCERGGRRLDVLEFRKWCLALGTTVGEFMERVEVQLTTFEAAMAATLAAQKKIARKSKPSKKQSP